MHNNAKQNLAKYPVSNNFSWTAAGRLHSIERKYSKTNLKGKGWTLQNTVIKNALSPPTVCDKGKDVNRTNNHGWLCACARYVQMTYILFLKSVSFWQGMVGCALMRARAYDASRRPKKWRKATYWNLNIDFFEKEWLRAPANEAPCWMEITWKEPGTKGKTCNPLR